MKYVDAQQSVYIATKGRHYYINTEEWEGGVLRRTSMVCAYFESAGGDVGVDWPRELRNHQAAAVAPVSLYINEKEYFKHVVITSLVAVGNQMVR